MEDDYDGNKHNSVDNRLGQSNYDDNKENLQDGEGKNIAIPIMVYTELRLGC